MNQARHAQLGKIWLQSGVIAAVWLLLDELPSLIRGEGPLPELGPVYGTLVSFMAMWNVLACGYAAWVIWGEPALEAIGRRTAKAISGLTLALGFIALAIAAGVCGAFGGHFGPFWITLFSIGSLAMIGVAARSIWILTLPREAGGFRHREVTKHG